MSKIKKTFKIEQINKLVKISHNKKKTSGENKNMENINNKKIGKCNLHIMPTSISDNDISALFNGLLQVIKKKFELDSHAQFININISIDKLKNELKNKINECNRLKNEIVYLKSKLNQNNN